MAPGDGRGVHGSQAPSSKVPLQAGLAAGRVHHQGPALRQPCYGGLPQQVVIQNQQMIRLVDLVAVGDRPVGSPRIGTHRGPGPFAGVVAEGLHALSQAGIDRGQDLGAGHASLAAAAV